MLRLTIPKESNHGPSVGPRCRRCFKYVSNDASLFETKRKRKTTKACACYGDVDFHRLLNRRVFCIMTRGPHVAFNRSLYHLSGAA
jgi:hypothetical protein